MAPFCVIDNSVVMTWCFEDEATSYGDGVLEMLSSGTALAPSIWSLEVANVLVVAERRKRLSFLDSLRFISLLRSLPIRVEATPAELIWSEVLGLARNNQLSSYDAAYLHLAITSGLPIASLDKSILKTARKLEIPVLKV